MEQKIIYFMSYYRKKFNFCTFQNGSLVSEQVKNCNNAIEWNAGYDEK